MMTLDPMINLSSRLSQYLRLVANRIEFGDLLLSFYFIVLIRPWFWNLENLAAWCLTIPLALIGWGVYVATKDPAIERPGLSFWLIVALPLLFAYIVRAPFPDTAFDVWSVRLFHGERGLRGFIYRPEEFFPTSAPYNPAPDMLTGIFRHLLGYRLGTAINLLVLIWTGTIVDKLLRPYLHRHYWRAICVLLVLWTEHVLFVINNYMVDLLALPLMLEATRLVLQNTRSKFESRDMIRIGFLVSVCVTFKLSNAALAAPLVGVMIWQAIVNGGFNPRTFLSRTVIAVPVFAAPLIPFSVWVYQRTGNPMFPFYNAIFKSPFYPFVNGWDGRWGGYGAIEILSWPILIFFHPQRTAEISVYSGRLSIGFIVSLACLIFWRRVDYRARALAFIIILGSIFWSLTMGYIRYGLYLELAAGVLLIIVASQLALTKLSWKRALASVIVVVMFAQFGLASFYASREEWSMRPTVFHQPRAFANDCRYLFRDRSIRRWLSAPDRESFDQVDLWVVSGSKTAGLVPFLNDRVPVIGVRSAGLFVNEEGRRNFANTLDRFAGRRMFSIAFPSDFEDSVAALRSTGLDAGQVRQIEVPVFAPSNHVVLYFFEVHRVTPEQTLSPARVVN